MFTTTKKRKKFIEDAGYEVFRDGHSEVNLNDEQDQSLNYFKVNRKLFLDWLRDELSAANEFKPDIVVNSPSFFGPLIRHRLEIPYVTILNAQWLTHFRGLLGIGKSKEHFWHKYIRKILRPIFTHKFEVGYLKEIRTFYRELGVGFLPYKRIELHAHNPVLIPSIYQFEPLEPDNRDDIHYVGPLFWKGFENLEFDKREYFQDLRKPTIYLSLGGSIFNREIYNRLIAFFSKHHEWNKIFSIGPNFDRSDFPKNSSHFIIEKYLPGLKVSEQSDVVVNTASHGTVMQALWHGRPLVVIPHNIDQGTIGARIQELGLGINLNQVNIFDFSKREKYFNKASSVQVERIIQAINEILEKPHYKYNARKFSVELRQFNEGSLVSADYIEFYAKRLKR